MAVPTTSGYTLQVRRTADGLVRECAGPEPAWGEASMFYLTEGNYGCDCNRHLLFERAGGADPETFVLSLPLANGAPVLALAAFIGGLFGSREPIGGCNYFAGGKINAPNAAVLGQTRMANAVAAAVNISVTHNSGAFASSTGARHGFAQGFEADGTTPAYNASIYGYHSTALPSTAEGIIAFATRTAGGSGAQGDRMFLDGPNSTLRPATDNVLDAGTTAARWKQLWAYIVDAKTEYRVNGTKVVGAQATGWTAGTGTANKATFATYNGATMSAGYVQAEAQATNDAAKNASQRVKAIEDALRTHGLIN